MKLVLVYAGDPDSGIIQSPYCITNALYYYLKNKGVEVRYFDWLSTADIDVQPDEIVLGHPAYSQDTVIQKMFRRNQPCIAKCTIHPFHTGRPEDNMPFDGISQQADRIFSICGPFWYDTADQTCFASWKPKMVRLDMAVNSNTFPYLRTQFNPPGRRRLVYIGSSMPQKNLGYMVQLMQQMPDVELHWYGGDGGHPLAKLPNVKTVGWVVLGHDLAAKIVSECDIFINTSHSDANPTTLLEARAFGIITACTKESGYYNDPFFTELYLNDLQRSVSAIRGLLNVPSEALLDRAKASRAEIETKYTWDRFGETVWNELQRIYTAKTA
jgi:glycosyltransferase involved in cell wall biosynthesis